MFIATVLGFRAGYFSEPDLPLLSIYCRAIALEQKASAALEADGYVTDEDRPSAWLAILQAATRTIVSVSRQLRISPSSRQPSAVTDEPVSYYDRMRLLEGQRDDDPTN